MKTFVLSDGSALFFSWIDTLTGYPTIYRFKVSMLSVCTYTYQSIPVIAFRTTGQMMISDNKLFLSFIIPSSLTMNFYSFTFGGISTDWTNMMLCPVSPWNGITSEVLFYNDHSKFYSIFAFGPTATIPLYIVAFNVTNGSVIDTMYQSSISINMVDGSTLNNDYIAITLRSTSNGNFILLWNLVLNTFTIRSSTNLLYGLWVEPKSTRYLNKFLSNFKK